MTATAEKVSDPQPGALQEVTTALAEFDRVAAGIGALRQQYQGVVYDVTTTKGMKAATDARAAIREPRYELERTRKALKAPLLKLGKDIDTRAAQIAEQLLAIEGPIDAQVKAEEARKEKEREAKAAAEVARVTAIQERIAELRGNQLLTPADGSKLIAEHIADLEAIDDGGSFAEFTQLANSTKAAAIERLTKLLTAAQAHEAEQERLRLEREQLAAQRAAQEETNRKERERIAAEEAAAKAKRDAEEAEARRKREAEEVAAAAERKRLQDEHAAKLRAEREESERLAKQQREQREREESERRERQRIEDEQRAALILREQEEMQRQQAAIAAQKAELERQAELLKPVAPPPEATKPDAAPDLSTSEPMTVAEPFAPSAADITNLVATEYGVGYDQALAWCMNAFNSDQE